MSVTYIKLLLPSRAALDIIHDRFIQTNQITRAWYCNLQALQVRRSISHMVKDTYSHCNISIC